VLCMACSQCQLCVNSGVRFPALFPSAAFLTCLWRVLSEDYPQMSTDAYGEYHGFL